MSNPFLEAALAYRAAGLHPVPVEPRGKRPLVKWQEYQKRQPTEEEIRAWWDATPDANVALAMGRGTFVLDIDGDAGWAALREAGVDIETLDGCAVVNTGKGAHFYFRGDVPDRIGVLEKVDVRSDGGYVVAPPSVHASGRKYEWACGPDLSAGDEIPPAPQALLDLLARPTKPTPAASPLEWLLDALDGVGEGRRDVTCARLAGYFLGKGVPAEAVEVLLQTWADRCTPPFPAVQVAKCVASIARRNVHEVAGAPAMIGAALDEMFAEVRTPIAQRKLRSTELPGLDALLSGGFEPGELALLGARPGVGKTALALQIARRTAEGGTGVLLVSREMRAAALCRRWVAQASGVSVSDLKRGGLLDVQWKSIEWAIGHLRTLPIWITRCASPDDIRDALAAYEPGQVGLVIVDYLQLMRGPNDARDKRATVEYVAKALKDIAIDYALPVLCLSSLRRLQKRKDGEREKPDMSDLRESGELEHDGDIVLLMTREFDSDVVELTLAKNRDGRVGTLKLRFRGEVMRLEEIRG